MIGWLRTVLVFAVSAFRKERNTRIRTDSRINGMIDSIRFYQTAMAQVGKPYGFGCKWDLNDPDPRTPIDCSGFVRWLIFQASGLDVGDGSAAQFSECLLLNPQSSARPGDAAFFNRPGVGIHHVGLVLDDADMIEARGLQTDNQGHPIYNRVILRPRSAWTSWNEFTGFMRFKALS